MSTDEKDHDALNRYVEELPHDLRAELKICMYEKVYPQIRFLKLKDHKFICWICPLLKNEVYCPGEYVYYANDEIESIYFVNKGTCNYVLPDFSNTEYISVQDGDSFGVTDIVGACFKYSRDLEDNLENWPNLNLRR